MQNKTIIFLMGPTACGKTDLAIALAKDIPIEIINVDSAQVYIGMDIGTNKPNKMELAINKHHLIDICSPKEHYSVGRFCLDAKAAIEDIHARGKIPLLVGGTMLYFYALCFGLADLPAFNLDIRDKINIKAKKYGWPYLHAELDELDPVAAKTISPQDGQRIQRALEVNQLTKRKFSEYLVNNNKTFINAIDVKYFAITHQDRTILHKKIENRFYNMLKRGLLAEVKNLLEQNVNIDSPAMRCVGYRQIIQYLQNIISEQEAYQKAIAATRQLAKKQHTWLRKWQNKVELNILSTELPIEKNLRLITRNIKC